jgi:hypothetical protein
MWRKPKEAHTREKNRSMAFFTTVPIIAKTRKNRGAELVGPEHKVERGVAAADSPGASLTDVRVPPHKLA